MLLTSWSEVHHGAAALTVTCVYGIATAWFLGVQQRAEMSEEARKHGEVPHPLVSEKTAYEPNANGKDESDTAAANTSVTTDNSTPLQVGSRDSGTTPTIPPAAPAAASVPPPPNGGVRAWLQVLGSFCLYFNTWGKSVPSLADPIVANSRLTLAQLQASCLAMARSKLYMKMVPSGATALLRFQSSAPYRPF